MSEFQALRGNEVNEFHLKKNGEKRPYVEASSSAAATATSA